MNARMLRMLAYACAHYESHGFTTIDVPWTVTSEVSAITSDDITYALRSDHVMVGSAEQSFLQQMIHPDSGYPEIEQGHAYQAITPCFRGDSPDELHKEQFVKLELFQYGPYKDELLQKLVCVKSLAMSLFEELIQEFTGEPQHRLLISAVLTGEESFDINMSRFNRPPIELGSYGVRTLGDQHWMYATGLALPRFINAVDILSKD